VLPVALTVLVLLLPAFGLNVYWQREVILIAVYSLITSGLNLSFGYAGELALGQVAIMAGAAYVTGIMANHGNHELIYALLASTAVAAVLGFLTGVPGLRLSSWALGLVSFFLVLLLPGVLDATQSETGGTIGLGGLTNPTIFGIDVSSTSRFYLVAICIAALWLFAMRNMMLSPFGVRLKALRESPMLAQSLGNSVFGLRMKAYVIGSLPAGIAGCLFGYFVGFLSPTSFSLSLTIAVFAACIVGGADSIYGAPVGAAILVIGPMRSDSFERYSLIVYGAFLLLVGVGFASGLAGLSRRATNFLLHRLGIREPLPHAIAEAEHHAVNGATLEARNIVKSYGGVRALDGVDLVARAGEITALIGANGAGKTTLLNVVSGSTSADGGTVTLDGERIDHRRAPYIARLGVARTFQTPAIPRTMTALEVAESGRLRHDSTTTLAAILRLPAARRNAARTREVALSALGFASLTDVASRDAQSLPLGTRRLLEVVRAVASEPRVVLLDEPAAGLDEASLNELRALLLSLREAGATIVIIEHNVQFVLGVADHVQVLELGRVLATGAPDEIRANPDVIRSYLGRNVTHDGNRAVTRTAGVKTDDVHQANSVRP
jgi:branched-chain amino acid transport system permease protein